MNAQEPRADLAAPVRNPASSTGSTAFAHPSSPPSEAAPQELTPEERINIAVYQLVNRGVVNINTKSVQTDRFMMFEVPSEGEGSGSVIDREGHILTNFHVVDGAKEIQVTLFDGKTYPAGLIGRDPDTDIAVLKIDAPADSLFPVQFGNSANLLVGQRVMAIGNPFGLERTLTTGIISSLNRSLNAKRTQRTIKSIIQIDAAINPGNSGGPLLDNRGLMIGMNTAIASKTGENTGVGFAIPANTIARVVPQLIANGRISRPESGIAQVYQTDRGLLIIKLVPGGPAEKAGLRGPRIERKQVRSGPFIFPSTHLDLSAADLIVAVDGKPVRTGDNFLDIIETKKPGDAITLGVLRGGGRKQVSLKLEAGE
ncbi:MAG: trypsin-like peptidase domain-containing protein [Pirellulales bacterium]|nr:trypsin-like peptidase domain-containing protein [Pirellulales bacterium]